MKLIIFIILNIYTDKALLQLCSHKTCSECIGDTNRCVWCALEVFKEDRCVPESTLASDWCLNNTINPSTELLWTENRDFNSASNKVVQLKPQKANIYLRAGDSIKFDFFFKGAKDYPVDLYFLFDASKTMKNVKDETANQIENIYQTMKSMTDDVYMGMGSFVDKNALPYTRFLDSSLVYSFRNRLPLTDNVTLFQKTVAETPFGENYDEQEGTLDALAQVITCRKEINWRNASRKIIFLLTNSPYHAAGDGKLAGIVKPYDGKCHLENGDYKNELEMDYPSVSIIRKLAAEKEMTVVFIVNSQNRPVYKPLSNYIKVSKITTYDGGSLTKIVKGIYQEIIRKIKVKVITKPEHAGLVQISFNPRCHLSTDIRCAVQQNETKKITATISLKHFDITDDIQVDLLVEGIQEKLSLTLTIIKDCNCAQELASPKCSSKGTRKCGICECDIGRSGNKCECEVSKKAVNFDTSSCIAPNSSSICNNNPRFCKCGLCTCDEGLSGKYCECGPKSCKKKCRVNEYCNCGTCACIKGWTGDTCSCTESKTECTEDGIECNNRGDCVCGACKCHDIPKWDARRKQSEKCMVISDQDQDQTVHSRQCLILENCALCYLNEASCPQCVRNINVTMVANLTLEDYNDFPKECQLRARVGCYTKLLYRYRDGPIYIIDVMLQTELDCAESYYVTGITCFVVMILIGIITLLVWRYMVDKHDREEFERLFKDLQARGDELCNNPLYEPATKTFSNPAFRKSSIVED